MSITDRLFSKLEEKMSTKLGYRGDLYTADYRAINKNIAKVLVGYNTDLGQPTSADLSKFLVKTFSGRIIPKLETARIYPNKGAVSLITGKVRPTKPYRDRKGMLAIAATLYLDETIGDKWEVEKNGSTLFLARVDSENISEIIAKRRKAMQIQSSTLTFASLQGSKCIANAQTGDTVKFFKDNQTMEGKVLSIGPTKVTVKTSSGNFVIDPAAIFEVIKIGPSTSKDTTDILRTYYQKAYPGDYGNMYIDLYESK